jgi:citrate lyase beta subunit
VDHIATARSLLFVPADDPRKLASAARSQADLVVADLEDSVAAERKNDARVLLSSFARERAEGPALLVRVNGLSSSFIEDDLDALSDLPLTGLVVPKVHAEALSRVELPRVPIVAMVEDARGLLDAFQIATDPRVARLALGGVDLAAQLGLGAYRDGLELVHARSTVVVASGAAGIPPPVDTPFLRFDDLDGLRAECRLARALGFTGKACIHPSQLAAVAEAFLPSREELDWAADILHAFERAGEGGSGVTSHGGSMVDEPVVARARLLLSQSPPKGTP